MKIPCLLAVVLGALALAAPAPASYFYYERTSLINSVET